MLIFFKKHNVFAAYFLYMDPFWELCCIILSYFPITSNQIDINGDDTYSISKIWVGIYDQVINLSVLKSCAPLDNLDNEPNFIYSEEWHCDVLIFALCVIFIFQEKHDSCELFHHISVIRLSKTCDFIKITWYPINFSQST